MVKELIAQDPRDLRKIDALVAEHVMGLEKPREELADLWDSGKVWICPETTCPERLPYYSSSIAAAWEVVEQLSATWVFQLTYRWPGEHGSEARFSFVGEGLAKDDAYTDADTASVAICIAAPKTRGITVE